jgi:uncharacterized iron-regulated membrane protein
MTPTSTRRLLTLHRWCGLVVSANVFVLALTGLVLIFHEEIDHALGAVPEPRAGSATTSLAQATELARAALPGANPVFVYQEPDDHPGFVFVGLAPDSRRLEDAKTVAVDVRAGTVATELDLDGSFTGLVLRLHAQLLAGPMGSLIVGFIGLVFLTSLVTGAIVYGPIMRRFTFGLIRRGGAQRTTLADVHKLLGAATFGWMFVVGATGLLLSLGSLLLQMYSMTELARLGAPFADEPIVERLDTIDDAVTSAEATSPGRQWSIVALPGSDMASPRHYTVLMQGGQGFEAKLLTLALVDAKDPKRAEAHELPFYLKALLLSEPLHFGNYGGLPLKLVWAFFTLLTLVLSGSGVWVFVKTRERGARRGETLGSRALGEGPTP